MKQKIFLSGVLTLAALGAAAGTILVPTDQATIEAAVAAASSGDEIVLEASGSPYTLASNVTVPSGVTLRGETGNRADVVIQAGSRVIYLNQANATLANLTVSGAYAADDTPKMGVVQVANATARCVNCRVTNCNLANSNCRGAIRLTAGVVTNCLVDANYSNAGRVYSVGVKQEGGTLVGTVIRDNYYGGFSAGYTDSALRGGALFISGGTAINCHIENNRFGAFTDDSRLAEDRHFATGVQLQGAAQLVNCTVVGNTYTAEDTGRVLGVSLDSANASVKNCVILANGNTAGAIRNIVASSAFEYCAVAASEAEGCTSTVGATLAGDFVSADGFYRPIKNGAACDAGNQTLLPAGVTVDLAGNDRISGTEIDIGAVELDQNALSCHFTADEEGGAMPFSTTLTAGVSGGTTPYVYSWDLDGDGVYERSGTDLASMELIINVASVSNVTLKVTDAKTKAATFAKSFTVYQEYFYVDAQSTNPTPPYATKEAAAKSLADALAVATPNSTVVLASGAYALTNHVTVPASVTVRGETGDRNDVVLSGRQILLGNADAILADLTVGSTYCSGDTLKYGVIRMTHATACVTNCRVTGCTMADPNTRAPVFMTAGILSDCLVDANTTTVTGPYATGVRQEGGTVENCVIRDNVCRNGFSSSVLYGAALNMTGGTAVNCLVENNSLGAFTDGSLSAGNAYASGVSLQGSARLVNCTVVGNTYTADDTGRVLGVAVYNTASAKVQNCVILDNGNSAGSIRNVNPSAFFDHCAVAASEASGCTDSVGATLADDFVPVGGAYRPLKDGATCDAGDQTLLPSGTATDLLGNDRVSGVEVDIGAVELDLEATLCHFTAGATSGTMPFSTMLTAAVEGGTGPFVYFWDLDGDGVFERSGTDLASVELVINVASTSNVTLKVTDAASASDVFSQEFTAYQGVFYVDANSENPVPPYATKATAARSLSDALAVVTRGATVSLAAGAHSLTNHVTLPAGVTVCGETGDRDDVTILPGGCQILLENADSALADLTLSGANCIGEEIKYGALRMTHATARCVNCRLTACKLTDANARAVLNLSAGTVRDCLIDGNYAMIPAPYAMAVLMDGGALENCIVRGNACSNGFSSASICGAALNMTGGKASNCLVENNSLGAFTDSDQFPAGSAYASGVVLQGTAQLVNCLVTGNTYTGEDTGRVVGVTIYNTSSAAAVNCAILGNGNDANVERNVLPSDDIDHCAMLADEATGCTESVATTFAEAYRADRHTRLWRLRRDSPLVDAGASQPTLEAGSDLVGNPRLSGAAIDIGPFELQGRAGLMLFVK